MKEENKMKKHRIIKALSTLAIALMLLSLVALPVCAEEVTETSNIPQISFINPDFNIKDLVEF